jgi:hypothetical protein
MSSIRANAEAQLSGNTPEQQEMQNAFGTMLLDLRYPVANDGSVMQADFFAPLVAYHLVRCGWRPNSEKRKIKPRRVPGPGVAQDAVEWVDMSDPDDPLKNLASMSLGDIARLPDVWRHEAIRRLGGAVQGDLPKPVNGWKVETKFNITNQSRNPNEVFK